LIGEQHTFNGQSGEQKESCKLNEQGVLSTGQIKEPADNLEIEKTDKIKQEGRNICQVFNDLSALVQTCRLPAQKNKQNLGTNQDACGKGNKRNCPGKFVIHNK
jgi:hypothetical protein